MRKTFKKGFENLNDIVSGFLTGATLVVPASDLLNRGRVLDCILSRYISDEGIDVQRQSNFKRGYAAGVVAGCLTLTGCALYISLNSGERY